MFAKRISITAIVVWMFLAAASHAAPSTTYPRVANFYTTDPHVDDCGRLSLYDLVVMPAGMQDIHPDIIANLRTMNPDIIILAYFPAGIMWPEYPENTPTHRQYWDKVDACGWWLYDTNGDVVGSDDHWWFLNMTTECPSDPYGRTLGEWLASYIANEVYGTGLWDGIWIDGCFEDPTWINNAENYFRNPPATVDCDRDGIGDDPADLLLRWRTELTGFIASLRELVGDSAILVANGKQYMHGDLNGAVRENFPRMHGDWNANMFSTYGYVTNCESFRTSPDVASMITCFSRYDRHTVYEPYRTPAFNRQFRFSLTSALLSEGYFVFEDGSGRCLWWDDYYDIDLGNPTGGPYMDSLYCHIYHKMRPVWRRDFEKGYVICNPFSNPICMADGNWLMAEDGLVKITVSDARFTISICEETMPGTVDKDLPRLGVYATVTNPSAYAAPALVWCSLKKGGTVVSTSLVNENLIGKARTDTVTALVPLPQTLALETYTVEIYVAGPDSQVIGMDSVSVRRIVDFPRDKRILDDGDGEDANPNVTGEDNLLIYPQPAAFSSGENLRMEVKGSRIPADEHCYINMYDVRGRLIRSIYEGVYGEGLSLEIGLTSKGGEKIAPGLYIIVLEMGDLTQTRKIVLLK
jgi:hypothetical protein